MKWFVLTVFIADLLGAFVWFVLAWFGKEWTEPHYPAKAWGRAAWYAAWAFFAGWCLFR